MATQKVSAYEGKTLLSAPKRRVYKLYAVAFSDLDAIEVLAMHKAPVYLNYDRRIVLIRAVQELLDREPATVVFFRESVEKKLQ